MTKEKVIPQIRFSGFTDTWEQRKFSELTEIRSASRVHKEEWQSSGVPFYRSSDVMAALNGTENEKAFISEELYEKLSAVSGKLEKGDILVTGGGSVGKPYIVPNNEPLYTKDADLLWVKNNEKLVPYFIYTFFFSPAFSDYLNSVSHVGTIAHYTITQLEETPITLPCVSEQQKIGDYFRNIDSLITLHQRKYDKLTKVKKAMLEKMFPENGSPYPEIRFKGFTDAWEQRKLGEVVKEVTRNDSTSEAPIMMITANNGFIEQSERYAFNNAGESLKKYILLEKGELAYNHGASKLRPYGSCFALTTAENARIPFVYHCFSVENQNAEFMSIELNSSEIENQLRKIVSSGARMDGLLNISFDEYSSVSVVLPSIEEQDRIAGFLRNLDRLITLHQRKLEKLKNIKKACLEKMFV